MRRAVLLLGLAFLVPGAGQAAEPGPPRPIRLVAVGDFGVGGETQRRLGAAIRRFEARNPSDYLLALGDNDYTESPETFRANWSESFGWTKAAGVKVAGVLGNHDVRVDGGRYEFAALGMPGRYYRRGLRTLELYLLDSNDVDAGQTEWLRRTLARSRARWRIAVLHHPPFTCGAYVSHPKVVAKWVPLFERHRVQLVLSGHDHNYQRFAPRRGVRYVVHGGGNPNQYPLEPCPAGYPRRVRARREHGFLHFVIRRNRIDGYAVTASGRRSDHFVVGG
ncbi:MAG TPA: metallophosphoesterase [Gaiellaceae bacterium]|nr:metallophosphoesterase [Gaiellaceae bacterium]